MANQDTGAVEAPQEGGNTLTMDEAALLLSQDTEPDPAVPPTESSEEAPEQANPEEPETKPEATTEDAEGEAEIELPDTFDDLAAVLGVEPEDLANHIRLRRSINGTEEFVTVAEALQGNMMEADYRLKTRNLAEQHRAFQAELEQFQAAQQQRSDRLDDLITTLEGQLNGYSQQELNNLLREDVQQYMAVKDALEVQHKALDQAKEAREQARTEQQQKQLRDAQAHRERQQALLLQALPELRERDKQVAFERDLSEGLAHYGFSDQEINGFLNGPFDHRHVMIARDAAKYRALAKSQLPKRLQGVKKIVKPGSSQAQKRQGTGAVAAAERLDKLVSRGASRKSQMFAAADLLAQRRK